MRTFYLTLTCLLLAPAVCRTGWAGAEPISCQATDGAGKVTPIPLAQSGHISNQYEATVNGFEIKIHQYGFFDRDLLPEVSFKVSRASKGLSISTFGRAQLLQEKGFVEGPRITSGSRRVNIECHSTRNHP